MNKKKNKRPPEGTPEFKEWLKEQAKKDVDAIFGDNYEAAEFDEHGIIFGDIENLDKTDAELFPDELEEYTPEEHRKKFIVHSNDKKQGDEK